MSRRKVWTLAALGGAALAWRLATRPSLPLRPAHVTETEEEFRRASTRVIILGAGFAGLAAALSLDRRIRDRSDVSVLVVDHDNSMRFDPLMWLVADRRAEPVRLPVPLPAFHPRPPLP